MDNDEIMEVNIDESKGSTLTADNDAKSCEESVKSCIDEKQLLIDLMAQMKELTEAVNKLCEQNKSNYQPTDTVEEDVLTTNKKSKPKKKKFALIGEIFFYSMLVLLIVGAFLIRSSSNGRPISIAGYSAFTVLTSSMESVYPKGSLVVTKTVAPETLKIDDDITFLSGPTSTITHRIIGITEEYLDTGQRAFETKGVENPKPDKNMVPSVNVVGKVVYHSEFLGQIATFSSKNWPFLIFVLVVSIALFTVLKRVFRDDVSEKKEKPLAKPQSNVNAESKI